MTLNDNITQSAKWRHYNRRETTSHEDYLTVPVPTQTLLWHKRKLTPINLRFWGGQVARHGTQKLSCLIQFISDTLQSPNHQRFCVDRKRFRWTELLRALAVTWGTLFIFALTSTIPCIITCYPTKLMLLSRKIFSIFLLVAALYEMASFQDITYNCS